MNTLYTDILIIGAGAAGMAAVLAAEKKGYQKILLAERKETPGAFCCNAPTGDLDWDISGKI